MKFVKHNLDFEVNDVKRCEMVSQSILLSMFYQISITHYQIFRFNKELGSSVYHPY